MDAQAICLEGAITSGMRSRWLCSSRQILPVSWNKCPVLASLAHAKGALLVVSITEGGVASARCSSPAEADIVAMEGQSFGLPPSYGGPYAEVIATRDKYVRQMPGRLAGETVDTHGKRGYVLTLVRASSIYFGREKATSNICHQPGAVRAGP